MTKYNRISCEWNFSAMHFNAGINGSLHASVWTMGGVRVGGY